MIREKKGPSTKDIADAWDEIEADEPDISTERLAQMVADRFGLESYRVLEIMAGAK